MAPRPHKRLRWTLGFIGVAFVLLVAFTGWQALQARGDLQRVAAEFEALASGLAEGDEQAAAEAVEAAQVAASDATDHTTGPGWWLARRLPVVGDDVDAVQTVVDVTDVLADRVLPDIVAASETLDPAGLQPRAGRIRIRPIAEATPTVLAADRALREQHDRIAAIDVRRLAGPIAAPVELMRDKLGEASALTAKASYAVRLLPGMLGADGPRTYLMLFQNNSEIRATGGMPGALAVVRADDGKIDLVGQGTAGDLGIHDPPPLRLTEEEIALYERKLGIFAADINFTPDFPRTGELAQAMWKVNNGQDVDGVLSADPVALTYLLKGTGPVSVPGGITLTARNAVRVLLNDVYILEPDPARQNEFFAGAARAVFDAVAAGQGNPTTVLKGLTRATAEGRLYVWSSHEAEQALLAQTALSGSVPRDATEDPFVGVFLNDGTAAKLQYYMRHRVDVTPVSCNAAGRQELEVTVELESLAPRDAALLPEAVIGPRAGGGYFGVPPGHMRVNVHLYAPVGGWIESSAVDGVEGSLAEGTHLGHPVGTRSVPLAPGQTRRLTYTVMSGTGQTGDASLRVTPGVRSDGVGTVAPSACS